MTGNSVASYPGLRLQFFFLQPWELFLYFFHGCEKPARGGPGTRLVILCLLLKTDICVNC